MDGNGVSGSHGLSFSRRKHGFRSGWKITRAIERGLEMKIPVIIVSASGARMYEGILSLMQMAKTSSVARLAEAGIPIFPCSPIQQWRELWQVTHLWEMLF